MNIILILRNLHHLQIIMIHHGKLIMLLWHIIMPSMVIQQVVTNHHLPVILMSGEQSLQLSVTKLGLILEMLGILD